VALLEVGRIVKPHGLRGEVVVELSTNRPERLAPGSALRADGRPPLEVERSRPFEATGVGRWIVTFRGVTDRAGADALRGVGLLAEPLTEPDALWVHELIGCDVALSDGRVIASVVAVEANPASDLLVLSTAALIPLRFVVSHGGGRVVVDIPDGLLEL